jgi:hypothetical protein
MVTVRVCLPFFRRVVFLTNVCMPESAAGAA